MKQNFRSDVNFKIKSCTSCTLFLHEKTGNTTSFKTQSLTLRISSIKWLDVTFCISACGQFKGVCRSLWCVKRNRAKQLWLNNANILSILRSPKIHRTHLLDGHFSAQVRKQLRKIAVISWRTSAQAVYKRVSRAERLI